MCRGYVLPVWCVCNNILFCCFEGNFLFKGCKGLGIFKKGDSLASKLNPEEFACSLKLWRQKCVPKYNNVCYLPGTGRLSTRRWYRTKKMTYLSWHFLSHRKRRLFTLQGALLLHLPSFILPQGGKQTFKKRLQGFIFCIIKDDITLQCWIKATRLLLGTLTPIIACPM